jgi:DNA (cytosine-5)-methyltransferase 1
MERAHGVAVHPSQRHDDFRGLSLCAGVGGLDLGLHLAEPGYRTVGYVERNAYAAATLVARMADASLAPAVVWDDLRSFDGRPWRDRIHLVSGGYPCQPFSFAGLRRGKDDDRHLWPQVARIVDEVAPEWCFFENVVGHLSLGLNDVIRDLQGLGFRVAAGVFSAAEVGAPHIRERVFLLAHSDGRHVGQPGLHHAVATRDNLPHRPQSDGQADRNQERGDGLVLAAPAPPCGGLVGHEPGLFPPLPGRLAEWGEVLERRPDLEPCLHRLDDGLAPWVEQSVAAGNGVVPMAAARAWRVLKAELMG